MNLVVLSGSGISAESGIPTFRGNGGLWEGFDVHTVATPEAWNTNPASVLRFYNERRKGVLAASPNAGHLALVSFEKFFSVQIITQNVDDLHERAGSSHVLHLHGDIRKARSTLHPEYIIDLHGTELNLGDTCPSGSQLRPHIVWFGEEVSTYPLAEEICRQADILIITGTSLQVYPAAGLVYETPMHCKLFVVDPEIPQIAAAGRSIQYISEPASLGIPILLNMAEQQML